MKIVEACGKVRIKCYNVCGDDYRQCLLYGQHSRVQFGWRVSWYDNNGYYRMQDYVKKIMWIYRDQCWG